MEYIEIVNLIILGALTAAYFIQNNKLKILKTIIDSYQPEKIKQAQDFIEEGNKHKYNLILKKRIDEVIKESSKEFQSAHKTMLEQWNELINFPFSYMKDKNWEERNIILKNYPKTEHDLRGLLTAYDKGELEFETESDS